MRWFESPTFFNAMVSGLRIVHRFVVQKAYPTLRLFCAQNWRNLNQGWKLSSKKVKDFT